MRVADATEIKNRFGEFVDSVLREPVVVRKSGREVAVILAWDDYRRLTELEDRWWALRAVAAEKEGYLEPEASQNYLQERLKRGE